MRLSTPFTIFTGTCVVLVLMVAKASAYFVITQPTRGAQWVNGVANPVTWSKGVLDGIPGFDVEMARLGQDGLTFVARNVPATITSLNIMLQDVPAGDDYFLIFINSTHGVMYATSQRFTILPTSAKPTSSQPTPISNAITVTVSGSPNPTQAFATTLAALANGILGGWGNAGQAWGLGSVVVGCLVGATWTLW